MKINVTKSTLPPYEEFCEEIKCLWESHWITNGGEKYVKLHKNLKHYLGAKNLTLFVNGHLALETVIASFNFEKGSEIITTPFTFVSTTNAIVRNGLVPVFCDINKDDYTIDCNQIEKLITKKTVAIVPVHVYGNVCNVKELKRISVKYGLKVIYDAAHAFGVKYHKVGIGNYGDASMFSFHATKVFNTIEGGCVMVKDDNIYKFLNLFKNFGIVDEEHCSIIGLNAKMNEFQAAMGICNLRKIDESIRKRRIIYERYFYHLKNIKGIILNTSQEGVTPNYSYFPVLFDGYKYNRDEIKDRLASHNIFARKYFYPLVSDFDSYKYFNKGNTPVAKYVSDRILTLPLYPDMDIEVVDEICKIILND